MVPCISPICTVRPPPSPTGCKAPVLPDGAGPPQHTAAEVPLLLAPPHTRSPGVRAAVASGSLAPNRGWRPPPPSLAHVIPPRKSHLCAAGHPSSVSRTRRKPAQAHCSQLQLTHCPGSPGLFPSLPGLTSIPLSFPGPGPRLPLRMSLVLTMGFASRVRAALSGTVSPVPGNASCSSRVKHK